MNNNKYPQTQDKPGDVNINVSPEAAIVDAVKEIYTESIRCFNDYAKCKEYEITERERICACLDAVVEKINSNKEMYLKTLELNLEERKTLYNKADEAIKIAIEMNNVEMLKVSYNYMLTVFQGGINSTNSLTSQVFLNDKIANFLK